MDDSTKALLVLGIVVVLFVWNRLPIGVVAIFASIALWATDLVTTQQAVAGFGDPVVIFIATLFVISEAIDANGVTTWAGRWLLDRAGTGHARVVLAVCVMSALLTSLITLNGAVAALLPLVVLMAQRVGRSPSQLLMPVAFAGSAGSLLMLMSSPVNVIVSEGADEAGAGPFPFFSFALVGIPLLLGTVLICVTIGPRVLPRRVPAHTPPDLASHAETLEAHYDLSEGVYRLRVRTGSPLIGTSVRAVDVSAYDGVHVVAVETTDRTPVPDHVHDDDVVVVTGPAHEITQLAIDTRLAVGMTHAAADLLGREAGVAEVVVAPRSALVGEKFYRGMRRQHDLLVLAVQRLGRDRGPGPVELAEGDAILVHGRWSSLDQLSRDRDVLLVDSPGIVRRQAVPWGAKATTAVAVLAVFVAMLASGRVPPAMAGLIAVCVLVLAKVVTVPQVYRSISWQTIVLVGALIPLSTAIESSGAADRVSSLLIDAVGTGRPYLLLAAIFALTAGLGQVVSNTATVLVVLPVAVAAAQATGTSVRPVLMVVAIAGSASLLTPIATPGNMMIMGPGGYRFGDYWKLGLPVLVWWCVVALVVVPLVWSL